MIASHGLLYVCFFVRCECECEVKYLRKVC